MTVRELIKVLQKLPQEKPVVCSTDDNHGLLNIISGAIEIRIANDAYFEEWAIYDEEDDIDDADGKARYTEVKEAVWLS